LKIQKRGLIQCSFYATCYALSKPNFLTPGWGEAVEMLCKVAKHFANMPVLVASDSWFGNDGLDSVRGAFCCPQR